MNVNSNPRFQFTLACKPRFCMNKYLNEKQIIKIIMNNDHYKKQLDAENKCQRAWPLFILIYCSLEVVIIWHENIYLTLP